MNEQALIEKYEVETGYPFYWADDLLTARMMLEEENTEDDPRLSDWLYDVIESANHSERKWLRAGIELTPKNLWYDYRLQQWIK